MTATIGSGIAEIILALGESQTESMLTEAWRARKVRRVVEDAVDTVGRELERFLLAEVKESRQRQLVADTCIAELRPLVGQPDRLFAASLNPQRVYRTLYPDGKVPESIREERLEQVWELFVPRVLTLVIECVVSLQDWESEKWREDYRRFDELAARLARLQEQLDGAVHRTTVAGERLFERAQRSVRQRRALEVEVTGLAGAAPSDVQLDLMFVHPGFEKVGDRESSVETYPDVARAFLGEGQRTVIIAGPGAGKSTWCRWTAQRESGAGGIVLFVELRSLPDELPSVHMLLADAVDVHLRVELSTDAIARWFDEGRVGLLIDGLDEIQLERRDTVVSWLEALSAAVPRCFVCLTSRPLTTDHLSRQWAVQWATWKLSPFDEARVSAFIEAWHRHAKLLPDSDRRIDSGKRAREWRSDPTLAHLTENPLLLSTLLTVHHMEGKLPNGRATLYRRFVDGMLGGWDSRRKVRPPRIRLTAEEQRKVVRSLSITYFEEERETIDTPTAVSAVVRAFGGTSAPHDPEGVLDTLRERSGLLIGPGTWNFAHKSIGEFLLAEVLVDGVARASNGDRLDRLWMHQRRHNDRLNTAIFFWAGMTPVAELEAWIQQLLSGNDADRDLAYGLAFDQYDRTTSSVVRQEVSHALQAETRRGNATRWVFPFLNLTEMPTGDWKVRSVAGELSTGELVLRLQSDKYLGWENVAQCDSGVRDRFWLFADTPGFLDPSSTPPPLTQRNVCSAWDVAAYFVMRGFSGYSAGDLDETLRSLVTRGACATHIPILALAAVLEVSPPDPERSTALLNFIAKNSDAQVPLSLLLASEDAVLSIEEGWRSRDMLELFEAYIAGPEAAQLVEPDVRAACGAFCSRLIAERESARKHQPG